MAEQHYDGGCHCGAVRYGVDLVPYDTTWIVVASALLVAGVVLVVATGRIARRQA